MDKATELKLIGDLAKKLGRDSYCGPALVALLPYIENQMKADFPVDLYGQFKQLVDMTTALESDLREKQKAVAEAETKQVQAQMALNAILFKVQKVDEALDNAHHAIKMYL